MRSTAKSFFKLTRYSAVGATIFIGLSNISQAQHTPLSQAPASNILSTNKVKNNPELEEIIRKSRLVVANNKHYLEQITAGKIKPFAQLRERYQQEFPLTLQQVAIAHKKARQEKDPIKLKKLALQIQSLLFPIGAYLQASHYEDADMSLTSAQHAELERIQKLSPRTQIGAPHLPILREQDSTLTYTMLHVPVSLAVKAQPKAPVYFISGGGGQFSNGMPMQEVIADDQGIAATSWISKGDSVGISNITVTSPQSGNPAFFKINVVGLKLRPLPEMPKINPALKTNLKLNSVKQKMHKIKPQALEPTQ